MASLLITEYSTVATSDGSGAGQAPVVTNTPSTALSLMQEPPVATQTAITLSSSSQQSAAFDTTTRIVRIWTDATVVHYLVGANPTATTATGPLDLSTNGFAYLAVKGGHKIAVRTP